MAKIEQMLRLKLIEDYLRSKKKRGASYEEIRDFLARKYEEKDIPEEKLKFTPRTFQRDKQAIAEVLNTEIEYRRASNTYAICNEDLEDFQEDVFDNLLLVEAFRTVHGRKDIMLFEQRKSRGLHWLSGLVHAITHRKLITLCYTKFWEGVPLKKTLEPYALKEFRNRWYLLANERDGQGFFIKILGLDRITELEIAPSTFRPEKYDVARAFKNSFGIISTLDEEAQEIVLSFDPQQGNYVKTLPLHATQEIMIDDESEFRIRLRLVPTYDLEREILAHGNRVKVLSPKNLRTRLKKEVEQMLENFQQE